MTFPLDDELVVGLSKLSSPRLGLDPKIMECARLSLPMGFKASRITCGAPGQETTVKSSDGVG